MDLSLAIALITLALLLGFNFGMQMTLRVLLRPVAFIEKKPERTTVDELMGRGPNE